MDWSRACAAMAEGKRITHDSLNGAVLFHSVNVLIDERIGREPFSPWVVIESADGTEQKLWESDAGDDITQMRNWRVVEDDKCRSQSVMLWDPAESMMPIPEN